MSIACRSCRRPAPAEKSSRVIYLARPHDIFDLFTDELEAVDCPFCGSAGSVTPNLLALSLTAHELIHLDRGAGSVPVDAIRESFTRVRDLIGQGAFAVQPADSYQAFKAAVASRIKATANLYPNFELLAPTNFESLWQHCEGEVFAAVTAVSAKAVPGVRSAFTDPESGEQLEFSDIVEMLEYRTTQTMQLLAFSLTHFHQAAIRVEEYLLRLVETSPFLRKVEDDVLRIVSLARDAIKAADPKQADAILWFQIYALEASLFLFFNKEYPREAEWAEAFLKLQVVSSLQLDGAGALSHLNLANERVRSTIGLPAAFNAAAKFLTSILQHGMETGDQDFVQKWTKALEQACERFGRPSLFGQVLTRGFAVKTSEGESELDPSPQTLAEEIAEVSESRGNEVAIAMIPIRLRACDWGRDPDSLDVFAEHLSTAFQQLPLAKARLLKWYGQQMKDLNQPARALMRIGRAATDWEFELPTAELRELWTERASSLRLVGARDEALGIAKEVLNLAISSLDEREESQAADLSVAWLNLGIYLRETGLLDEALAALSTAVKISPENSKPRPLESLGWALLATGRAEQALECLRYARHILKSPDAGTEYYAVLIGEGLALLMTGERAQAEALISHGLELAKIPVRSLPQYASIFSAIASRNTSDPSKSLEADKLLTRLGTERQIALRDGNTLFAGALFRSAALVSSTFHRGDEESLWRGDAEISAASGEPPVPVTAVEVARFAAREGPAELLEALGTIRRSLEQNFGSVALGPDTVSATAFLDGPFDKLLDTIVELQYEPRVIQLAASLRRNAHSQAIRLRQSKDGDRGYEPLASPDDCCFSIAQGLPSFAVLEWIDVVGGAIALISVVDSTHAEVNTITIPPTLHLYEIADAIGARLLSWRATRKGEPFEVDGWDTFRQWITEIVGTHLPVGGHLVIIDHARFSSVPYHVALVPHWSVSYAADWNGVLAASRACLERVPISSIGVIFSPRANESEASLFAFRKSVERTREFAEAQGLAATIITEGDADGEALQRVISTSSIAKVMCHGQVSREDSDVGLLVAHGGALSPGYTFATTVKTAEPHRVGWRELSTYSSACPLVFVGACSSGKVHVGGLDERVSIFSSLSRAGTTSVVAPRWKIDVDLALPILDEAMNAFVRGTPLASAVNDAAMAAVDSGVPLWQACAFVIEGGWR